ncbi:MAG: N-acetylmuramoyl-L-alanine amidase [Verrucomicrobiaceae bacterium]
MTSGSPASLRRAAAVIVVAGFALAQIQPARGEEEKKGFFSKMFGGGKTEEKPAEKPAVPKEEPKAESKPKSTSSSKSKSTASKPKTEPAKTTTPKKAEPKPVVAEKKPEPPKTTPKIETKPTPAPQPKAVATMTANVKKEVKPSATNPWHIIDIGGRDYVTLESIRNFYNPVYGFSSIAEKGNFRWLTSPRLVVRMEIGSTTLLMNNMKFVLSYPVITLDKKIVISRLDLVKLIDPILLPSHINNVGYFDTVVIDAGHGGHDSGARGVYGYEKDYALATATRLRQVLITRGIKAVLTRTSDTFISLSGRVSIANQIPNSIFVSIHFNSGGAIASGVETWALTPQGASAAIARGGGLNLEGRTGNSHDSANIALASAVHSRIITSVKTIDRGIMRAQWSVLSGLRKPGILIEGGFVTNPTECGLIRSIDYQDRLTRAIAEGIVTYRSALVSPMTSK